MIHTEEEAETEKPRRVTCNFWVDENQLSKVRELSKRSKVPMAVMFRDALERTIVNYQDMIEDGEVGIGELNGF